MSGARRRARRAAPPAATSKPLRVLYVEHTAADVELVRHALERAALEVAMDVAQTLDEFTQLFRSRNYDLVLADYRLPGWTGMEALDWLMQQGSDVPFIMVSGSLGDEAAVECLKRGASDYVLKDHLARLPVVVRRALSEHAAREARARAEEALRASEAQFRQLTEAAPEAKAGNVLTGETYDPSTFAVSMALTYCAWCGAPLGRPKG